jgi:hypothetical protein
MIVDVTIVPTSLIHLRATVTLSAVATAYSIDDIRTSDLCTGTATLKV